MSVDNLSSSVSSGLNNLSQSIGSGLDGFSSSKSTGKDTIESVHGSLTTSPDVLDDVDAITMDIISSAFFPSSGSAKLIRKSDGVEQEFSFTGKTATALVGCLISTGTFSFNSGDKVEIII